MELGLNLNLIPVQLVVTVSWASRLKAHQLFLLFAFTVARVFALLLRL